MISELLAGMDGVDGNFLPDDMIPEEMQFHIQMFHSAAGRSLCTDAVSRAPLLRSNILQWTVGVADWTGNFNFFIPFSNSMIGVASLNACDDPEGTHFRLSSCSAVSVCSL